MWDDKTFDPYEELMTLKAEMAAQIRWNLSIERTVNLQQSLIRDLHDRVKLLEMARQYEEKN